jgi:hypothetical protein
MKHLLFILWFVPTCCFSQTDLLMLKKNGAHVITFVAGMHITMETIYDQWFDGTITAIRHDSILVNNLSFHYKEIKAIQKERKGLNYKTDGYILMAVGGGILVLGAVNGAYRGDAAQDWYRPASFIAAGALIVGGFVLTRLETKEYLLGKKFTLEYLELNPNKTGGSSF